MRKIKKAIKSPKIFLKDMMNKYVERYYRYSPIKHNGHFIYTVVSAVYNVEKYLDEYFISLINQSLNFRRHIYLILVDDGSTDNSAKIIKKWQKKYPENILYLYQKNSGISSARNLGLKNVKTKWVTFIDPDDKIDLRYFKTIDHTLFKTPNIGLAVGNLFYYFEKNKSLKDSHPLRYRFKKTLDVISVKNLEKNINLFVTVSFFKTAILFKNKIFFDEKVKPNFEDGKFLADYLLRIENESVVYAKKAIFHYRKREDKSSTIDNSWSKKEKYHDIFVFGYIPMLESYKIKYRKIPKNIQYTVIYEMLSHIKHLIYYKEDLNILSPTEKNSYYNLIHLVMYYVDEENINNFDIISFEHKFLLINIKHNLDYLYKL